MLPPKRGKQDEVNFQQHASLLNNGVKKMRVLESAEVKEQVKRKLKKRKMVPKFLLVGFIMCWL